MRAKKIAVGVIAGGMFLGTAAGAASAQLPEGYLQTDGPTTTAGATTTTQGSGVGSGGANQGTGGSGGSNTRSGGLSRTGSDVLPLVGIASAAVLLGGAFIYGARRPNEA